MPNTIADVGLPMSIRELNAGKLEGVELSGPVLLAVSGVGSSLVGAETARRVATLLSAPLHVVSIVELPMVTVDATSGTFIAPQMVEQWETPADHLRELRSHLDEAKTDLTPFVAQIRIDSPVAGVVATAREVHAGLIVVNGYSRSHKDARNCAFAIEVLNTSEFPVLAISSNTSMGYRTIVVAVDFSAASIRAAAIAVKLLEPGGKLLLMHVENKVVDVPSKTAAGDITHAGKRLEQLSKFVQTLRSCRIEVDTAQLVGEVAVVTRQLCKDRNADLLCVGVRHRNLFQRLILSGTSAHLLNEAECDVLGVPSPDSARAFELILNATGTAMTPDRSIWRSLLESFSERNTGRTVELEWDSPSLGAQKQARYYELIGVLYDDDTGIAQVFLRSGSKSGNHLDRQLPFVRSVAIKRNIAGRDESLQLISVQGTMLLQFL